MLPRVLAICGLLGCALIGFLVAQSKPQQQQTAAPSVVLMSKAVSPESVPNPDLHIQRLLSVLGGAWSISEELTPDAASPKGKTGQGTMIWRSGPGGFSLIEEYRSMQGNEEVTGIRMLWWDTVAQGYHTIWCDSTNPGGCIDFKNVALWDGSKLVLRENYVLHGKRYTFKEVFGDISSDGFTQTLYGGEVGSPLKVDQVIHARRLKSGGHAS